MFIVIFYALIKGESGRGGLQGLWECGLNAGGDETQQLCIVKYSG
jgi:hypothetical protein